jgi:type IX secretion system PorP/SprF family membrane protein
MNKLYIKPFFCWLKSVKLTVIITALLLIALVNATRAQQTFIYTQYMNNLTPLNTAYSLLDKAGSINTLVSKRLVGIDGAPTTLLLDAAVPLESINGNLGLVVKNDAIGVENLTEVNAFFAKAVQLTGDDYLSVSISGGFTKYVANYSSLSANDPQFSETDVRQTKPNVGFSVLYFSDNYYFGLSVPELTVRSLGTASAQDNNYFKNNYYFSGAILLDVDDGIKFKPSALVAYSSGVPVVANISGTIYLVNVLGLGANYCTNKQIGGILSYSFSDFRLGYSYQVGTSSNDLGAVNNATHEISLTYRFGKGSGTPRLL